METHLEAKFLRNHFLDSLMGNSSISGNRSTHRISIMNDCGSDIKVNISDMDKFDWCGSILNGITYTIKASLTSIEQIQ